MFSRERTTIHCQNSPCDLAGSGCREEGDCGRDILRLTEATKRDQVALELGKFAGLRICVGIGRARLDKIDRYVAWPKFPRQTAVEGL